MTTMKKALEDKAFRGERQALVSALGAALPRQSILSDEEDLKPYECDGLSAYRSTPFVVVLPETVDEVQHILRICQRLDTPVVV
ncbi:MAG: FAD-binding oxidoreductase, partial [Gammaproteobacteria bacterium]|nr:FAD-binding oxidoreductase [Gammaproteobacteria bacterium]